MDVADVRANLVGTNRDFLITALFWSLLAALFGVPLQSIGGLVVVGIFLFVAPPIVIGYLREGLLASFLAIFPYTWISNYLGGGGSMSTVLSQPSFIDLLLPSAAVSVGATVIGYSIGRFVAIVGASVDADA